MLLAALGLLAVVFLLYQATEPEVGGWAAFFGSLAFVAVCVLIGGATLTLFLN